MRYRTVQQFIITATAVAICSACDKETKDPVADAPVAAQFTSVINATETRASGTIWAPGDNIGVSAVSTGTTSYENILYRAEDINGSFEVVNAPDKDNTIYFHDEYPVTFSAYYPYTGQNGTSPGILTYTITAADQTPQRQPLFDFMFATATGSADSPVVTLPFTHCMSRLVLCFFAGNDLASLSDLTYTLSGLGWEGTFNTVTGDARVNSPVQPSDLTMHVPEAAEMSSSLIVFPGQGDNSQPVKLTLAMCGLVYKATFTPDRTGNAMLGGHSYICNVTINKETLTIETVSIESWFPVINPEPIDAKN